MNDLIDNSSDQNEIVDKSPWGVGIKWGLIGAGALVLFSLLLYVAGLNRNNMLQWLVYPIYIGVIFMAINEHRNNELNGRISIGRCIGLGMIMAIIMGAIYAIYTFVFFTFIAPNEITDLFNEVVKKMEETESDEEKREQALKMVKMFFSPTFFAIASLVSTIITNFILSVILGAFLQKK